MVLTGCSTFTPYDNVIYRSSAVGGSGPLQVGSSSRAEVIALYGKPSYRSEGDREFGYLFGDAIGRRKGLLMGPCAQLRWGEMEVIGMDDIWLAFDENGTLRRFDKGLDRRHGGSDEAWQAFRKAS